MQSEIPVTPLAIPFPYRAMFTLCSDLDETPDRHAYADICRFLNTRESTPIGPGLGLEIGNTIYFDMPPDQFAYWNTDDAGREMVHRLIRSGHIDCIHSFGDLALTREQAKRNLGALDAAACKIKVWIDHAQAISNFGADIMQGQGDVREAEAFHADLSFDYGIEYVWTGRVTSVIGQNTHRSYSGLFDSSHALASLRTIAKEFAKGLTSRLGKPKYDMHVRNEVLRRTSLRSGHRCYEFLRSDPHWNGVGAEDSAKGLGATLNRRYLDAMCTRRSISIHYTHLGKIENADRPFSDETLAGLRLLQQYAERDDILVTTTRRILDYCRLLKNSRFTAIINEGAAALRQTHGEPSLPPDGLSFELPAACSTARLTLIDGSQIDMHVAKRGQKHVATVEWPRLSFPQLDGATA